MDLDNAAKLIKSVNLQRSFDLEILIGTQTGTLLLNCFIILFKWTPIAMKLTIS